MDFTKLQIFLHIKKINTIMISFFFILMNFTPSQRFVTNFNENLLSKVGQKLFRENFSENGEMQSLILF